MKVAAAFHFPTPTPLPRYGGDKIWRWLVDELRSVHGMDVTCYNEYPWFPSWKHWMGDPSQVPDEYDVVLNATPAQFGFRRAVNFDHLSYGHQVNAVVPSRLEAGRHGGNPKVVYYGTNVDVYHPAPEKEDYFAFFARMHPDKGPEDALEIARRAGIKLKMMGADNESPWFDYPELKQFVVQLRERAFYLSNVEYLGGVSNEVVVDTLGRAKALIYPIRAPFQFDMVVIEAMACGTPVLVSNQPAPNELVENGVTGRICHGIDEFCRAVAEPLPDPALVRRVAIEKWSTQRFAREMADLLKRAAAGETW